MKKWQEERNYRRVRNEGGEVIANKEWSTASSREYGN